MFGKRSNSTLTGSTMARAPYGTDAVETRRQDNAAHREMVGMRYTTPAHGATALVLDARRSQRALAGKR